MGPEKSGQDQKATFNNAPDLTPADAAPAVVDTAEPAAAAPRRGRKVGLGTKIAAVLAGGLAIFAADKARTGEFSADAPEGPAPVTERVTAEEAGATAAGAETVTATLSTTAEGLQDIHGTITVPAAGVHTGETAAFNDHLVAPTDTPGETAPFNDHMKAPAGQVGEPAAERSDVSDANGGASGGGEVGEPAAEHSDKSDAEGGASGGGQVGEPAAENSGVSDSEGGANGGQ